MMHFIKVAKSVQERMEELRTAVKDPKSREIHKLAITSTFSRVSIIN